MHSYGTKTVIFQCDATRRWSTSSDWSSREDLDLVRDLLIQHAAYTSSAVVRPIAQEMEIDGRQKFVKVMPRDYRRVLDEQKEAARSLPSVAVLQTMEVEPWVSRPVSWRSPGSCRLGGRFPSGFKTSSRYTTRFPKTSCAPRGARCMDCGVPFCHQGCPLGNLIPDWNDLVYRNQWRAAIERLHLTNNFPEFTGKLCPAPCEASCVLGINSDPVAIKQIEAGIIERAWNEGWVVPQPPKITTGKKVAIVGSGPAGLAAAQQLARAGHAVTVFERDDRIGGLLRYGIPDFKMEKRHLDRRLQQMEAEGVVFRAKVNVGLDIQRPAVARRLRRHLPLWRLDAASRLADRGTRARWDPLRHAIPDRPKSAGCRRLPIDDSAISSRLAANMSSSSAVATPARIALVPSIDKSARAFINLKSCHDLSDTRAPSNPWPQWSNIFRVSSAHEEGGIREYAINTKRFLGKHGRVRELEAVRVEMKTINGRAQFVEIPDSTIVFPADLVLLAMGFVGPEKKGLLDQLGVELDQAGNVKSDGDKRTSVDKVFTAGDMTRGQSLIVWAIAEGRHAAHAIDVYLMGSSDLPEPLDHDHGRRPFS